MLTDAPKLLLVSPTDNFLPCQVRQDPTLRSTNTSWKQLSYRHVWPPLLDRNAKFSGHDFFERNPPTQSLNDVHAVHHDDAPGDEGL